MALPSSQELKGVIVDILTRARDEGRLDQLTVRIVLRELATHYGLEQDVFQTPTYKPFIKDTVFATVNSFQNASDGDADPPRPKATKEEKSDSTAKAGKRKRRSAAQVHSSKEEPTEEANASESEAPPPKKASARSKPSMQVKPGKTSKKPESETKYKSKAVIESSDEEAPPESGTRKSTRSPKKEKTAAKSSPPKPKQQKVNKGDSNVEMARSADPGPSSSSSKPKPATESPKHPVSTPKELSGDPMESELSSVIDEPQTKRQKKQKKESVKPQKEEKAKRGKKKEVLSKDEETVNKLKGIVVACGVRKVWKKEFERLDKPSQQIKRLHSMLGDLGMTPRYSMEKAKAIREQRELAQELQEVQAFDRAIKRRQQGLRSSSETGESMDGDKSDADVPARKKKNARASIMAFLQDQSEEE
ncbi:hypothetical protein OG21DRAFT_1509996 [Imleria badia]|nr:hypothetical protein OG21DRAFT_1509996 [Imleria badia]